jgi:hypothetical protein
MEDGSKRKKKGFELGEFFLWDSFDTGEDLFHSALGQPAEGFLQGLLREVFLQERPHLHPGLPAIDEITAGKVGLDPAAVVKSQHGPHLGAIDLQEIVFVNHDTLPISPKPKNPKTVIASEAKQSGILVTNG